MGGHTPIFVKNGRPLVKLCSSKVKGLLTYIVTLGHCDIVTNLVIEELRSLK